MRYFIDSEFLEDGSTIMPISVGVVAEDGRELYFEVDFDQNRARADAWLVSNVLARLSWPPERRVPPRAASEILLAFTAGDPSPLFWAYYADYDWVLICQLFGRMVDLPKRFPKFCMDLQQWYVQLGSPEGAKPLPPRNSHNALADAKWNALFYDRLSAVVTAAPCMHVPLDWVSNADGEGRMRCRACGAWRGDGEKWPVCRSATEAEPSVSQTTGGPVCSVDATDPAEGPTGIASRSPAPPVPWAHGSSKALPAEEPARIGIFGSSSGGAWVHGRLSAPK